MSRVGRRRLHAAARSREIIAVMNYNPGWSQDRAREWVAHLERAFAEKMRAWTLGLERALYTPPTETTRRFAGIDAIIHGAGQ